MDDVDKLLFKEIAKLRNAGRYLDLALRTPENEYLRVFALAVWEQTRRGGCP